MRMIKTVVILAIWALLMIGGGLWLVASDADTARKDEEWHEQYEDKDR